MDRREGVARLRGANGSHPGPTDDTGHDHGHLRLHVAGTSEGRAARWPGGSVCSRCRCLRDGDGEPAVQRDDEWCDLQGDSDQSPDRADTVESGPARRAGQDHLQGARERSESPIPVRRGSEGRSEAFEARFSFRTHVHRYRSRAARPSSKAPGFRSESRGRRPSPRGRHRWVVAPPRALSGHPGRCRGEGKIDRRSSLRQPQPRSRERIFQRRAHRGHHHSVVEDLGLDGDLPLFGHALQEPGAGTAKSRARVGSHDDPGRERPAFRGPTADQRPTGRCRRRQRALGRDLRPGDG